ncbi:hypothetical protein JAAARDRAFT_80129 [Jaapia argillacea MUCL 33604]|uniref:Uncharacterized protein n=1 Tax=Jaapia argillacea MUCL 33604 TaxID=933084 RepID=A0A067PXA4_9AGAM|nr:hypothetical protein JAAARDRAFT_80129 [Jaapia argillacea MUCL 33604]
MSRQEGFYQAGISAHPTKAMPLRWWLNNKSALMTTKPMLKAPRGHTKIGSLPGPDARYLMQWWNADHTPFSISDSIGYTAIHSTLSDLSVSAVRIPFKPLLARLQGHDNLIEAGIELVLRLIPKGRLAEINRFLSSDMKNTMCQGVVLLREDTEDQDGCKLAVRDGDS